MPKSNARRVRGRKKRGYHPYARPPPGVAASASSSDEVVPYMLNPNIPPEQQLEAQVSHPSEAGRTQMRDDSLLQNPNLLTLIFFEFRCTLFKKGDTIKLFNKDASQWNTCRLSSDSFQRNVVNRPECKGGPKYIESKYNVQGIPLEVRSQPDPSGKFIRLLQKLYPFESCYSSDRGKVTFNNIPEKLDFFAVSYTHLTLPTSQLV